MGRAWGKRGQRLRIPTTSQHRTRLGYLPRYQPALNPQERVWRRIRYEATTNRWFADLDAIWDTVQRTRRSWSPQKLKRLCHIP